MYKNSKEILVRGPQLSYKEIIAEYEYAKQNRWENLNDTEQEEFLTNIAQELWQYMNSYNLYRTIRKVIEEKEKAERIERLEQFRKTHPANLPVGV